MILPPDELVHKLLPPVPGLQLDQMVVGVETLLLTVRMTAEMAVCPHCASVSRRLHSQYRRRLADVPWGDHAVRLELRVRRFHCANVACPKRVFAERLPALAAPYARRTARSLEQLTALGFALGGEAGARFAPRLGLPVSPATLLRYIRKADLPLPPEPRVIGVDDFALRRRERYGTLIIDLERHRPVDVWADRTADTPAAWLKARAHIEVVARDRSPEYARGIGVGAPGAVQVADRWHLLENLRQALQRLLDRHQAQIRDLSLSSQPALEAAAGSTSPAIQPTIRLRSPVEEAARQAHRAGRLARYEQVRALYAQAPSILGIAKRLGMSRGTVRRYVYADAFPERARRVSRPSMLDPYEAYLQERWDEGCRNGLQLWRELRDRGYSGSHKLVSRWARERRTAPAANTPRKYRPKPGRAADPSAPAGGAEIPLPATAPVRRISTPRLAWLLVRDRERLDEAEKAMLAQLHQVCPDTAAAYPLAQDFGKMVRQQACGSLDTRLESAGASGLADLQSFAAGLERDRPAVEAALNLAWSNGTTEGFVNKLKVIKRQMYGRANVDLLRTRFLNAA